jgi:predicted ester cyclase
MKRLFTLVLLVLVAAGVVAAQDVSQTSRVSIVRRLVSDVYTGASDELLRTRFVPDATWRQAGLQERPLNDLWTEMSALAVAMPDLNTRALALLTDSTSAAVLTRFRGTFTQPLVWEGRTIQPNDKSIEWLQLDVLRFADGRVVELVMERDMQGLLSQLGAATPGARMVQGAQARGAVAAGQAAQAAVAASSFTREQEESYRDALMAFLGVALISPDTETYQPYFSENFVLHLPSGDTNLDGLASLFARVQAALPESLLSYPSLLVDDNFVAAQLVISGVFMGGWTDDTGITLPSNGQTLILTANLLARFDANGAIAEAWMLYDPANWTSQFAAVPTVPTTTP